MRPWQVKAEGTSRFPWCGRFSLSLPVEAAKERGGSPEWPLGPVRRVQWTVGAVGAAGPVQPEWAPPSQAPASSTQPPGLRLGTTWALPVREPPTVRAASLTPFSSSEDIQASLGKLSLWKGVTVTQDR